MGDCIEKIKRGKYTLKLYYDQDADNPRSWDIQPDKMICFHNRYKLGDDHDYNHNDYNGWDELEKQLIKDFNPAIIKPLYLYDHSGITISTSPFSCPWDSGQIGFILIPKTTAIKEWGKGKKRMNADILERCENWIKGQVETYDEFIRGDVYGFKLFEKTDKGEEEIDSCWGFYGNDWETNGIAEHLPDEFINYKEEETIKSI